MTERTHAGLDRSEESANLELKDVSFRYPKSQSGVSAISLTAPRGAVYGLLGENGAGKTTIMRLMVGLLRPDTGDIRYSNEPLSGHIRRSIGALIETPSLYLHLTGSEHLNVFAHYYQIDKSAIARVLALTGLERSANQVVKSYSLGMKQRLGLATALLHDPTLLILDEPTNGLDPSGIAEMRDLLVRLAVGGRTVVVSSHLLSEVERIASRVAIIHGGRVRFDGTCRELSTRVKSTTAVRVRTPEPEQAASLLAARGWSAVATPDCLSVNASDDASVAQFVGTLVAEGIAIFEVVRETSLERDFLNLLEGAENGG